MPAATAAMPANTLYMAALDLAASSRSWVSWYALSLQRSGSVYERS